VWCFSRASGRDVPYADGGDIASTNLADAMVVAEVPELQGEKIWKKNDSVKHHTAKIQKRLYFFVPLLSFFHLPARSGANDCPISQVGGIPQTTKWSLLSSLTRHWRLSNDRRAFFVVSQQPIAPFKRRICIFLSFFAHLGHLTANPQEGTKIKNGKTCYTFLYRSIIVDISPYNCTQIVFVYD
jgi:hypothetical protein